MLSEITIDEQKPVYESKLDNIGAFLNTSAASSLAPLSSFSALYIILSSFDS